ncbi:MAG: hypothetical protein WC815_16880 [Vicinamibacterales bacterium]|jgi:hypothetical protein
MKTADSVRVCLADPATQLPAVRRFWFDIYCRQMQRFGAVAESGAEELHDPLAARSRIALAVETTTGRVIGTLMSTLSSESSVGDYEHLYGMGDCACHPFATAIATKFMVHPEYRRSDLSLRLARFSYKEGLVAGVRRSFMDCNPPLIAFFLKLGYRPHLGWIDHPQFGRVFSMVLHLDDTPYLEAIDSPFLRTSLDGNDGAARELDHSVRQQLESR